MSLRIAMSNSSKNWRLLIKKPVRVLQRSRVLLSRLVNLVRDEFLMRI